MMKLLIGLVVAALLAVGFWVAMSPNQNADSMLPADETAPVTQEANEPTSQRGTFASLFGMSGSFKCTVTSENPNGSAEGVVYVRDGNVRGEFNTMSQAGAMTAYMIKDGDVVYSWSSAMPMGVKAMASAMESGASDTPMQDTQVFDAGASVDYSCEPTTIDAAMFVPPTNVEFMDMTAGMPSMPDLSKMKQMQ